MPYILKTKEYWEARNEVEAIVNRIIENLTIEDIQKIIPNFGK